jgi:hypothetical protein
MCMYYYHFKVSIPRPRSGHRAACDDSNMYVFGGFVEEMNILGILSGKLFHEVINWLKILDKGLRAAVFLFLLCT